MSPDQRIDPEETSEWMESFDDLLATRGRERAGDILADLTKRAQALGVATPAPTAPLSYTTDYVNTIPVSEEAKPRRIEVSHSAAPTAIEAGS